MVCVFQVFAHNVERIAASKYGPMADLNRAGKSVYLLYALQDENGRVLDPKLYRKLHNKFFLLPKDAKPSQSLTAKLLLKELGAFARHSSASGRNIRGRTAGLVKPEEDGGLKMRGLERKVDALEAEVASLRAQLGTLGKEVIAQRTEISRLESLAGSGVVKKPIAPKRPPLWKKPFENVRWSRGNTVWLLGILLLLSTIGMIVWLWRSGRLQWTYKYRQFNETGYGEEEFGPWYKKARRKQPPSGYSGEETVRANKPTRNVVSPEEPPPET
ncbi:MAG: hypothetical protein JNN11_01270 [Candidatus Doudnabacteria bacterium]|nr:hypothetical protein [Candidatus Doudnabacteria bacterium]